MKSKTKQPWVRAGSREAQNIGALIENRDYCYFIPPQTPDRKGFIPACVIENVEGYRMMSGNGEFSEPWYWGKTEVEANRVCDEMNAKRGITKERQQEIITSTMGNFGA